jgi:hypothetical protein
VPQLHRVLRDTTTTPYNAALLRCCLGSLGKSPFPTAGSRAREVAATSPPGAGGWVFCFCGQGPKGPRASTPTRCALRAWCLLGVTTAFHFRCFHFKYCTLLYNTCKNSFLGRTRFRVHGGNSWSFRGNSVLGPQRRFLGVF